MSAIQVLSFNIRNACDTGTESWASRRANWIRLVRNANPDLMGLQEVLHRQYTDLQEAFPDYGFAGVGRDDGRKAGEYTAILYRKDRFTFVSSENFWLSETPGQPSLGWDAACIRICTSVVLFDTHTSKSFVHFNTHLDHAGGQAQREGARLLKDKALHQPLPAVITGDFNVYEQSETYGIMTQDGLCDAKYRAKQSMRYGTFHGYQPSSRLCDESPIDFIFYTEKDFAADRYAVLVNGERGAFTSDHYPVLASLTQL